MAESVMDESVLAESVLDESVLEGDRETHTKPVNTSPGLMTLTDMGN